MASARIIFTVEFVNLSKSEENAGTEGMDTCEKQVSEASRPTACLTNDTHLRRRCRTARSSRRH
jgi:hypothetical protein